MADRVKKTKKLGAVLVAAALAAASVVGNPSGPANAAEAAQNSVGDTAAPDPFYDTAGIAPAVPGEILRKQTAPYSNVLGSTDSALPDEATKIMYTTTDANGKLTPVTGYVVEPTVPWRGKGPRPTVVVGRGTVGQGDQCAPSRNWPLDGQPDPLASKRTVNMEGLYDFALSKYGVRVVVTDLVGMGTEGVHTYMNRLDQAHAMLDAGRAVKNLVGEENFGKIGFYGHSQGGGASAAAVEEASNYYSAEEQVNVAGAYASAPPANLYEVSRNIDGSDLTGAIGFAINGMVERYDGFEEVLNKYLSDDGQRILEEFKEACTNQITSEPYAHMTTREWTKDGRSLEEILKEPDMAPALEKMNEQEIGRGAPVAPVMVISGRYDRQVEFKQARNLAMKWCTVDGAEVIYRDDIVPEIGDGMPNHLVQALSGPTFGFTFMLDRFNDKPLPEDQVCKNFGGDGNKDTDAYGSGVAMSSHLSSLPLSSKLVPDNAPETGPSSGVDGSGVSSPEGILAAIIIAVLGIIGVGVGSATPILRQMLKI